MPVHDLKANMTHGAITPLMHARVDSELYQAGLATARNWIVLRYGGLTRAPGTLFKGTTRYGGTGKKTYFIPFRFKRSQVYYIEAGDQYFRFWTASGQVTSGGSPVTVATPYLEADLYKLQVRQSGDVVYIVCDGYQPRTLTRSSETSWALAAYQPLKGPYLDINDTDTTLTPADTGSVTPQMSSNTSGGVTVSSTDGGTNTYTLFNRGINGNGLNIGTGSSGTVSIDLGSGNAKAANSYWLVAGNDEGKYGDMPTQWVLSGSNDNSTWTALDSRDGETGWAGSETRFYDFTNTIPFRYYKFDFGGGGGNDATGTSLVEISLHQYEGDQTPFNLTASSTVGINDGAGFQASDVGRFVRLYGADGRWRDAQITDYTSSTVVKIVIGGWALRDTSPIINWQLGAWSDSSGWPKAIGIRDDRIIFAGSDKDPLGIWGTRPGDYDNFGLSEPLELDDSFAERLTGGELNPIQWLIDAQNTIAGTEGSIRALGLSDPTKAFGPGNIRQLGQTPVTTGPTPGFQIDNFLIFLDLYGRRLFEAQYSNQPDAYVARELSVLHEHLFATGVVRCTYQAVPFRIIWCVTSSGSLLAVTYDRDNKVFGITERPIDGVVDDVLSLPSDDADAVMVSVRRTLNGSSVGCVELLAPFYRSDRDDYPVYADSAIVYTGVATGTVTGADHFNGETVGVYVDGFDAGDVAVSGGSLTLPNGLEGETIIVGKRITSRVESLRLANAGGQDGAALGRKMRLVDCRLDLFESAGLKAGTLAATYDIVYDGQENADPFAAPTLMTGSYPLPGLDDSFKNGGVWVAETDRMYPATLRAVLVGVDGEP